MASADDWDDVYKKFPLKKIPWQTSAPEKNLVKLVESGKIVPGKALDMCSGIGINSIYLASKGFDVKGVDISKTAVSIANDFCSKNSLSCRYFQGDVMKKRFSEKFDLIFDRGCFHHIINSEKPAYAKKVHGHLARSGAMFLQCFSDKNHFEKSLSKEEIRGYFSSLFKIVYIKESTHTEPDGMKIFMYDVFMKKMGD